LAEASDKVNEMTKEKLVETIDKLTKPNDTVAVLGMAYKPDTWLVEESAGLHLAQHLQRRGRKVLVHDFAASPANSPSLHEFTILDDPKTLRGRADVKVAVLCCPWPQYASLRVHPATKLLAYWKV
jgi:UDPglucose 6-dehydrogenase